MFYAWISQIRAVFARRSLAVFAGILAVAYVLGGTGNVTHLLPLALVLVAAMTALDGTWLFWRRERRRRSGIITR